VRPRNWLVLVALATLREESTHSYELMEGLAEFGFEEINTGTLYRALRQMEKAGFCTSEWETSKDGPARRVYSVTNEGEAYHEDWVEGYKKYQQVMDAFSLAYRSNKPPS
jgi:poly-beta-hydroxybutyrate-responsive repressor